MTHISNQPARARTDLGAGHAAHGNEGIGEGAVRRLGLGLAVGTLCWAIPIFIWGTDGEGAVGRIIDLTGLLFQLGVFCLLTVQMKTGAIGTSRAAAIALRVEAVVLGIASLWSLLHGVLPASIADDAWLAVMDMTWPLSMLGMFLISVKLVFAGRWQGPLRWWPLIAESWAVATVPFYLLVSEESARWIGGGHLLIGYTALGLIMAARPNLTTAHR